MDTSVKPPDGGWGWMVVFGSFISYFLADGWSFSFGVLFPTLLEFFNEGTGKTSLIAALLYGIPLLISPVVCALTCCYGCRPIAIIGGLLTASSMIFTTFAQSVNGLCLTIGMLGSVGLAMVYIPALLIVTFYFEKRRGLATGLAVTGSGLGSICFPPIMDYLLATYAWRGFLFIMGGLSLHMVFAGALFRPLAAPVSSQHIGCDEEFNGDNYNDNEKVRTTQSCIDLHHPVTLERYRYNPWSFRKNSTTKGIQELSLETKICFDQQKSVSSPELSCTIQNSHAPTVMINKQRTYQTIFLKHWKQFLSELQMIVHSMLDKSLICNWAYLLFCGANFFLYLWIGVPYIFLIDRALHLQIVGDIYFLSSIIGIGRTFGQIALGYLGDLPQISCPVLYAVAMFIVGVDTMLVPLCNSYISLCVYAAVYGFFVSATYAIQMICIVDIVSLEKATSAFGLLQLLQGVATILGTPLAGWLYDISGGYDPTFYTSGAWMMFCGLALLPVKFVTSGRKTGE